MNAIYQETLPQPTQQPTRISSIALLAYGAMSYLIGVTGLGALILGMAGLIPMGQIIPLTNNSLVAFLSNAVLTTLFGLQHSVMARPIFKSMMRRMMPEATERSTYVLASGLVTLLVVTLWQPLQGSLWQTNGVTSIILWAGFIFGWAYLFAATFCINHWDLFGLRQVWFAAHARKYQAPAFVEHWMYRYSRHPIMLGALIGIWCLPQMSMTTFSMTLLLTFYTFIGIGFEERDLLKQLGQRYAEYRNRVGMFFTLK